MQDSKHFMMFKTGLGPSQNWEKKDLNHTALKFVSRTHCNAPHHEYMVLLWNDLVCLQKIHFYCNILKIILNWHAFLKIGHQLGEIRLRSCPFNGLLVTKVETGFAVAPLVLPSQGGLLWQGRQLGAGMPRTVHSCTGGQGEEVRGWSWVGFGSGPCCHRGKNCQSIWQKMGDKWLVMHQAP